MEENRVILRSYSKIKSFENKIYRLGNTRLVFPLPIGTAAYFIGVVLFVALIDSFIGFNINPVYKYVGIPGVITYLVKNRKIDGKPAHKYFIRLIQYQFLKKSKIERFEIREKVKPFVLKF
ncbi:TcpE family conjugal transfer membrane protein [Clostridium perfringens]|uniref:TcpE family conjugal transfer membrane protein n=1 Tax=Clostridium perfringens TaxID=1502 RepID=UPI0028CE5A6B|nr:TcpE family conjugal transfer membrane protein [Clostridium perfringens]MDT7989120.1 TcpE family conjugal transfer membrane protein [Clostridium perfringens]